MRHLLLAALTALFTTTAAPAFAMSINFSYTGTVSSDVSYNLIFPSPSYSYPLVFGQNLTGKPVFVSETFNLQNADLIYQGSYIGSLGGIPGNFASAEITIGNVSAHRSRAPLEVPMEVLPPLLVASLARPARKPRW
jgi:hypothetical protein